jgi:hypothetical protein
VSPTPHRQPLLAAALVLALAGLACTPFHARGADRAEKAAIEGRALAAAIRDQRPAQPTLSKGTLRVRHADGRRLSIPVQVKAELGTNAFPWTTVYEAKFPDGRKETLRVVNLSDAMPHFILHRAGGDGNITEIRPQRPDEMFVSFAGTDFWFVDLGMTFLHWPDQRVTGSETRRTRRCHVLESRNPLPGPGAYQRVVTWVDEETGGIVRAEAYDSQNRRLKEFTPGSFAKIGARYELRDMEIRNEQTESRTTLQFEVDDPEKLGVKHLPTTK